MRTPEVEALLCVLAGFSDTDSVYDFACDLLTVREIEDMAQRLEVARRLAAGASYMDIQRDTGASATTISRVSKCLNYGTGGYEKALSLLAGPHDSVSGVAGAAEGESHGRG